MRAKDFINEAESYQPPKLEVGDKILKGKFKNSPAEIKGFTKDKHNQPVLKTNKGEVQLFKPRVVKLMKESFNTHLPYKITLDYPDTFRAQFKTSAGLNYEVNIGDGVTIEDESQDILYDLAKTDSQEEQMGELNGLAFIMFHQDNKQGITGTGNATEVISTVLAIIGYFWDKHHPKMFAFHSIEPSRTRLYLHIASKIPGFKLVGNANGYYLFSSI